MRITSILLGLLILILGTSCGGSGGGGSGGGNNNTPPPVPDPETWTVFVYGHADHDLSISLAYDMLEMAAADLGDHIKIVVLADWDASQMAAPPAQLIPGIGVNYPTGAHWYVINGASHASPIEYLGEFAYGITEDLDDPNNLDSAIASVYSWYPSDHRGLVMWNHGGGWIGGFGGDSQDGTVQGPRMTSVVMGSNIYNGLVGSGYPVKLDFLGFDTCLMGNAEVIAELAGITKGYIACAEIDYGAGWDYTATFNYLSKNSYKDYKQIITAEVNHWDAHHANNGVGDNYVRAHAAWDLAGGNWDTFMSDFNAFAQVLYVDPNIQPIDVARGIYLSTPGYSVQAENAGEPDPLRDLGTFCVNMLNNPLISAPVKSRVQTMYDSADQMILNKSLGSGRSNQLGFSLELPLVSTQWTFERYNDYLTLAPTWLNYSATSWSDVLAELRLSSDSVGPVITSSIYNGTNPNAIDRPELCFLSADADVVEANVSLELEVTAGVYFRAGLIATGIVDNIGIYYYEWDGNVYEVDNGSTQTIGAIDPWIPGLFYSIKGKISDGVGGVSPAWLLVNIANDNISDVVYSEDGYTYSAAAISDLPSAWSFIPEWTYSTGATVDGTPINMPGLSGSLDLVPEQAPAANYRMSVEMIDVWGNRNSAAQDVTVQVPFGDG